jgi:hypothetical protein
VVWLFIVSEGRKAMFKGGRAMKKLMLVGLLIALIGVPIGNALAQDSGPSNLGQSGVYLYFPVVPSNFQGFDSILFVSSFFSPVALEINTSALVNIPGSPIQQTNVDIPNQFSSVVLTPRPVPNTPTFQCAAPPPNLCQLFIHHRVPPTPDPQNLNFTATLLVTNNNESFQFVTPYSFFIP